MEYSYYKEQEIVSEAIQNLRSELKHIILSLVEPMFEISPDNLQISIPKKDNFEQQTYETNQIMEKLNEFMIKNEVEYAVHNFFNPILFYISRYNKHVLTKELVHYSHKLQTDLQNALNKFIYSDIFHIHSFLGDSYTVHFMIKELKNEVNTLEINFSAVDTMLAVLNTLRQVLKKNGIKIDAQNFAKQFIPKTMNKPSYQNPLYWLDNMINNHEIDIFKNNNEENAQFMKVLAEYVLDKNDMDVFLKDFGYVAVIDVNCRGEDVFCEKEVFLEKKRAFCVREISKNKKYVTVEVKREFSFKQEISNEYMKRKQQQQQANKKQEDDVYQEVRFEFYDPNIQFYQIGYINSQYDFYDYNYEQIFKLIKVMNGKCKSECKIKEFRLKKAEFIRSDYYYGDGQRKQNYLFAGMEYSDLYGCYRIANYSFEPEIQKGNDRIGCEICDELVNNFNQNMYENFQRGSDLWW